MSRKCYGVGVIGCGVIWNIGHWPGLQRMPGEAQVRYVYDIDAEKAEQAAAATGARAVRDPDAIFADDVDIVTIATPPTARVDYVRKACAAGKHLMLEKPMARTLEDALEIYRTVRQHQRKCFVPFARVCHAVWRKAAEIVQSGALGAPLCFQHTFLDTPYSWIPLDHWMHDQQQSGGPIFDYSIHFVEFARAAMGVEAQDVLYTGRALTGRVKSDDYACLLINYQGGAVGQFTGSWAFPPNTGGTSSAAHLICEGGVLSFNPGGTPKIHTPEGEREIARVADDAEGRAGAYRNLIAAIEHDSPLDASELEGLRTIEILDAALKSRETGRREAVTLHQ